MTAEKNGNGSKENETAAASSICQYLECLQNSSSKHLKSLGDPDRQRVDETINNNSEMDGKNNNNGISKNSNFSFKSKSSSAKLQSVVIGNNLGENERPQQQ